MDEVIIERTWERKEFIHAFRRTVRITFFEVFMIVLIIGLGLFSPIGYFFIPLWVGLWLILNLLVLPAKCWNDVIGIQELRRTVISESGIAISSPSMSVKYDWSRFESATEKAEFYLLIPKKGPRSTIFVKRNFTGDQEQALFRALLRRHTKAHLKANPSLDALSSQID